MKKHKYRKLHTYGIITSYLAITIFLVTIIAIMTSATADFAISIRSLIGQKWVTITMSISTILWFSGSLIVLATEDKEDRW